MLPKESPVCFHGTKYGNIENILKSGGLSSSVDRVGYSTSYDIEDQVSVTVVNTLATTINGYTGFGSTSGGIETSDTLYVYVGENYTDNSFCNIIYFFNFYISVYKSIIL